MLKSKSTQFIPSNFLVKYNRFVRFIKVGALLHCMTIFSFTFFFIGILKINFLIHFPFSFELFFWITISVIGITFTTLAEADALGRYQNYKQIKDFLFKYGFEKRLIVPFSRSKCQREAVLIASKDLGIDKEVKDFFLAQSYKWYHILPDDFIKNPFVLFEKMFWERILFTKRYQLINFYW